jgi:hypothetical protein
MSPPGRNPFPALAPDDSVPNEPSDDILDPQDPIPGVVRENSQISSNISDIEDQSLDELIIRLRIHYRRAGVTMLRSMLLRLGYHIPRDRINEALLRIDPVQRVFQRIRIRRRVYSVPGPNALWHHDGQHGPTFSPSTSTII